VVVPAHDGEVQFLPGHAAFVGALGAGELRIDAATAGGAASTGSGRWFLEGGVVEVVGGAVTVLAERVRPAASLDAAAARRDLAEALAVVATTDAAQALKERRVLSARARLRIASAAPAPH
jgi:F0F1-type ATP synthase epsilon subunit